MSAMQKKPTVIGLYGVPGVGKSTMLKQLQSQLHEEDFLFFEGSDVIGELVEGGLKAFKTLGEVQQMKYRIQAISKIHANCEESGKTGIVTGHFMFDGVAVVTQHDLSAYTHILYLDINPDIVAKRCEADNKAGSRTRCAAVTDLREWQQAEKNQLRELCYEHKILFTLIRNVDTAVKLINDFRHHTDIVNLQRAQTMLDEVIHSPQSKLETVLVFDAHKTLAAEDTGTLFWSKIVDRETALKTVFGSKLEYSYKAFRQAMLLYEEAVCSPEFDMICDAVASAVSLYPGFVEILHLAASKEHVTAVVVTSGLRSLWEKILQKYGLSEAVKVVGGGRIADGFVVTAAVKAALIARLQYTLRMYVWAFGDSVLDLDMLKQADKAIVVVGDEKTRSKSMEAALKKAIANDEFEARQVLLPSRVSPRLNTDMLPVVQIDTITNEALLRRTFQVFHATSKPAAKLLMTPMRDANNFGPALREHHRRAGWYLATEYLTRMIGLEECTIPHVQGHETSGHRLHNEKKTAIVALMRGGEPMAFGISDAFPSAIFIHASKPADLKAHHMRGLSTLVLVDSVVNSGKTVVEFVHHVRRLHCDVRIVVVTGVVQAEAIEDGGSLIEPLAGYKHLSLVALRISENKYTGTRGTDTG